MKRVFILSILLLLGLVSSQLTPAIVGDHYEVLMHMVKIFTMIALSYVMILVGYEFVVDKAHIKSYGKDYLIAATTAALPWAFVAIYFVYYFSPGGMSSWDAWKESLLLARFAAPTSAGILFSMLAVAGLGSTWMFRKARILAIFDDLDTVIFMIPLKILIVGFQWQIVVVVFVLFALLFFAWKNLHMFKWGITSKWIITYSVIITVVCEGIYAISSYHEPSAPIHIEVLLPAFVMGCVIKKHKIKTSVKTIDIIHTLIERRRAFIVSAVFMILVGLSMPSIIHVLEVDKPNSALVENLSDESYVAVAEVHDSSSESFSNDGSSSSFIDEDDKSNSGKSDMSWLEILYHVFVITLISNLGKMFPVFCYKNEANFKQRLGVAVAMFPRGEVGAGVILISLSYGISGPIITVAMLSLALNLILTGFFIYLVKLLIKH